MIKLISFLSLLFTSVYCYCQEEYVGIVEIENSETVMDLELSFNIKNDSIFGFSVMNRKTDYESKSEITGMFDSINSRYLINEINVISDKSQNDSISYCLLSMTLSKDENKLSGRFIGNLINGDVCASGKITLIERDALQIQINNLENKLSKENGLNELKTLSPDSSFTIKTTNNYIKLYLWDVGIVDKDSISLFLNKNVILQDYEIKKRKKVLKLKLEDGQNKLVLKAENEGEVKPNTSRIIISDKEINYHFKYGISAKEKIILYITKLE
jgi:hypothetical protein